MIHLTRVRTGFGMSQAELARKAELNASTVSCIEREKSKPWPGQAEKIEAALKAVGWDGHDCLFEEVAE